MKRTFLLLIGLFLSLPFVSAQKVGYVNTETILNQIPQYVAVQKNLEELGKKYMTLIESESGKVDVAYKSYQADRPKLTEREKQMRESEIIELERGVKEKQKVYFGEDGVMSKKSSELLDPIKGRVEKAIEKVAKAGGYVIIIDLAAIKGVVYKDAAADLSLEVVKEL